MSENLFTTLTIDGVQYTVDDKTKLKKPIVEGTEGQVLTYTAEGPVWSEAKGGNVSDDRIDDITNRLDLIEQELGEVSSLADSLLEQTVDIIGE